MWRALILFFFVLHLKLISVEIVFVTEDDRSARLKCLTLCSVNLTNAYK